MLVTFAGSSKNTRFVSAGQNTVSQGVLEKLLVPVPPLNEQRRIVAKIEELFSDLDAGIVALERVRANLKRYRAAVLKAAVEGKLTEDWRAQHPDTEPASVLLERILTERRRQWEKDQLAKFAQAGKQPPKGWQRSTRACQPISTDLPTFPRTWHDGEHRINFRSPDTGWLCIRERVTSQRTTLIRASAKTFGGMDGVPVLRMRNIQDGRL